MRKWDDILDDLIDLVSEIVSDKRLSLEQIAKEIGLGHTTLRKYLSGKKEPTMLYLLRVEKWIQRQKRP